MIDQGNVITWMVVLAAVKAFLVGTSIIIAVKQGKCTILKFKDYFDLSLEYAVKPKCVWRYHGSLRLSLIVHGPKWRRWKDHIRRSKEWRNTRCR